MTLDYSRFGLLALLLLILGCRTYGNEQSRDLLVQSINESVTQVELEGTAIQQDANKLTEAAELNPALLPFAERARALAEQHQTLRDRLESAGTEIASATIVTDNPGAAWLGPDRYRELHRVYGTMITERQHLMDQREILARDFGTALGLVETKQSGEVGRYQIAPHHYHQVLDAPDLTDLLAQLGQAAVE